jgi:hypothetical protein
MHTVVGIHIVILFFGIYFLWQKLHTEILGGYFLGGLLLKIVAGVGIVFVLSYKYGFFADSQSIFNTSVRIADKFYENPTLFFRFYCIDDKITEEYKLILTDWTAQTVFMYKLTALFCLFTANNFWLVNIYLSILSYLGLWFCANALAKIVKNSTHIAAFAFLFFPSVLVWSAGILKESFLWFFSGLLIYLVLSMPNPANFRANCLVFFSQKTNKKLPKLLKIFGFLLLSISLSIALLQLKYYYFVVLIPVLCIYVIGNIFLQKPIYQAHKKKIFLFLGLVMSLLVIFISQWHDNLRLNYFFQGLVNNYYYLTNNSDIDNLVHYQFTENYFLSTLLNIPAALQAAWLSPMLWQTEGNFLKVATAIENTIVLFLFLRLLYLFLNKKINTFFTKNLYQTSKKTSKLSDTKSYALLLFCGLLYVFILSIFISLATPNMGTLVRYKVGFLPFFVFILLVSAQKQMKYKAN